MEQAVAVFEALDSFLHTLEKEGFVYNPKTEITDSRDVEKK